MNEKSSPTVIAWKNQGFHGLDELAERLGLAPAGQGGLLVTVQGCSGSSYDVIQIVHAVLDRLDAGSRDES